MVSGGEVDGLEDFLEGKSQSKVLKCGPKFDLTTDEIHLFAPGLSRFHRQIRMLLNNFLLPVVFEIRRLH